MSTDTKTKLIATARRLFAERGFYGVSIADIAEELGITKQALLYHFGKKERLYDAVLRDISSQLNARLSSQVEQSLPPEQILESIFMSMFDHALTQPEDSRVILRELMDNQHRAENIQDWVLKPYLDGLADLIGQIPDFHQVAHEDRFSFAYQVQGIIFYFMISIPTLENMYGEQHFEAIKNAYRAQLQQLIHKHLVKLKSSD